MMPTRIYLFIFQGCISRHNEWIHFLCPPLRTLPGNRTDTSARVKVGPNRRFRPSRNLAVRGPLWGFEGFPVISRCVKDSSAMVLILCLQCLISSTSLATQQVSSRAAAHAGTTAQAPLRRAHCARVSAPCHHVHGLVLLLQIVFLSLLIRLPGDQWSAAVCYINPYLSCRSVLQTVSSEKMVQNSVVDGGWGVLKCRGSKVCPTQPYRCMKRETSIHWQIRGNYNLNLISSFLDLP